MQISALYLYPFLIYSILNFAHILAENASWQPFRIPLKVTSSQFSYLLQYCAPKMIENLHLTTLKPKEFKNDIMQFIPTTNKELSHFEGLMLSLF